MVILTKREESLAGSSGPNGTRSLTQVPPGVRVTIRELAGGQRLAGRLAELGLFRGASLEVLSGGRRGPMIVRSGGSRLALGRGMALKIFVDLQETAL